MSDWMLLRMLLMLTSIALFVLVVVLVGVWTRYREHGDRPAEPNMKIRAPHEPSPVSHESIDCEQKSKRRQVQDPLYQRAA